MGRSLRTKSDKPQLKLPSLLVLRKLARLAALDRRSLGDEAAVLIENAFEARLQTLDDLTVELRPTTGQGEGVQE
jgi:hypothetical protein